MNETKYHTIIIGGGIAGLACARQLNKNGEEFLLVSKDIGGRIKTSMDGNANYGAFFVCSDYQNVNKYATLKNRIHLSDFCFHEKQDTYVLFQPELILYLKQFIKTYKLLVKFRKHLRQMREKCEIQSQKEVIKQDSFLHKLYMQKADDFINEQKINTGTEKYLSKALYSTTFSKTSEMNAFSFLQFLIPLVTPIYRFKFEFEKITKPFKENIKIDEVIDIKNVDKQYKIKTKKQIYKSKNLVLATEINWSQKYTDVKNFNKPVNTKMLHIKGRAKKILSKRKYHLFTPPGNVQAVANLEDETYLFYYKNQLPDLNEFFENPKILGKKEWVPAGTINGHNLVECNQGNNKYLIGDYNIAGLEETFITGIFCANKIIQIK